MKRILLLFVAAGMTLLTGCEGPQGPPGTTVESEVFELLNVDFAATANGYQIYQTLNPNIFDSDNILIYRLSGTIDSQTPIWQLIPRTLFLAEGELDYDFDFSREDFTIYAGGTYDLAMTPQYIDGQTFRIVIIPGYFSRTTSALDLNDYNAVITAFGLEGKPIKRLN